MSLPATLRLPVNAFLVLLGLASGLAGAAPVALDCRASGEAGSVTFRLIFDEAAKQISIVWATGGGRPHAPWLGEAGTHDGSYPALGATYSAQVTATVISFGFRMHPTDDPGAYYLEVDRTNAGMRFIRYNPTRISQGTCSPSAAPARQF